MLIDERYCLIAGPLLQVSRFHIYQLLLKSQSFRDNYPSDHPDHFFREVIFVPYLDHLIVEMEDRFLDQKQKCRSLWGLIPKYCDASPNTAQDLEKLMEINQEDTCPRAAVVPEVQRGVSKWKKEDVSTVPSSAIEPLCLPC